MSLQLDPSATTDQIVGVLRQQGAVIVRGLASVELAGAVNHELQGPFEKYGAAGQNEFTGRQTLRARSVLGSGPSAAALVTHQTVLAVAAAVLLPHCAAYQIGSLTGIRLLPGQGAQPLHRDDSCYPIQIPGLELQIGAIWALDSFTEENGATRVVPGSHRLMRAWHPPELLGSVPAVMEKGSVLMYLGSTWHGGGENRSGAPRTGLVCTYSLGWLRQEVNQYLVEPPEIAARYNEQLRALLGYAQHGDGDDAVGKFRGECAAWVKPGGREHKAAGQ